MGIAPLKQKDVVKLVKSLGGSHGRKIEDEEAMKSIKKN